MLRRGYALLVEIERDGVKAFERARDFDETNYEYIIADFDPVTAEKADAEEGQYEEAKQEIDAAACSGSSEALAEAEKPRRGKRSPKLRGVPASTTRAVAVSRNLRTLEGVWLWHNFNCQNAPSRSAHLAAPDRRALTHGI